MYVSLVYDGTCFKYRMLNVRPWYSECIYFYFIVALIQTLIVYLVSKWWHYNALIFIRTYRHQGSYGVCSSYLSRNDGFFTYISTWWCKCIEKKPVHRRHMGTNPSPCPFLIDSTATPWVFMGTLLASCQESQVETEITSFLWNDFTRRNAECQLTVTTSRNLKTDSRIKWISLYVQICTCANLFALVDVKLFTVAPPPCHFITQILAVIVCYF